MMQEIKQKIDLLTNQVGGRASGRIKYDFCSIL